MKEFKKSILYNINAHNKLYKEYEKKHGEIYNAREQRRLCKILEKAIGEIKTESKNKKCLDFGCGAGNLTKHLLEMNLEVYAADISNNFLDLVKKQFEKDFPGKIFTINLNGEDLSGISDNSFDFLGTYSVLHHVPDYLKAIREFCRVLKPGGVLYIDHEFSPNSWNPTNNFIVYSKELKKAILKKTKWQRFFHFFIPKYYIHRIKSIINPKFRIEGDIHVFPDDHIEWEKIKNILVKNKLQVICEEDYLLFRRYCPGALYEKYKEICSDERFLIARKMP